MSEASRKSNLIVLEVAFGSLTREIISGFIMGLLDRIEERADIDCLLSDCGRNKLCIYSTLEHNGKLPDFMFMERENDFDWNQPTLTELISFYFDIHFSIEDKVKQITAVVKIDIYEKITVILDEEGSDSQIETVLKYLRETEKRRFLKEMEKMREKWNVVEKLLQVGEGNE